MANNDIMTLLFGKKRRRRRSSVKRRGSKKRSRRGSRKRSGVRKTKKKVGWCVKKTKSGRRSVKVYTIAGKRGRFYFNGRKVQSKKLCYKTRSKAEAARKRLMKKTKRKGSKKGRKRSRRGRRRSSFGVGGSYMPLSSMMSPYPYSVNSSPPWAS